MRFATAAFLAVVLALGVAASAMAQGGVGASLDIQPGARENAMGLSGVALAEDASGVTWWNPAALGFVNHSAAELTYAQLVPGLANDVSYNYGTIVKPVQGWGAFGVGFVFLSYGTSPNTNESGDQVGTFSSNEFSPALYWGTRLLPDLAVGATLKYVSINLAPDQFSGKGQTFGIDVGGLYRIPAVRLNLGVNVQNLGPSVTFLNEDQKSPLSRNVKFGAAWEAAASGQFHFSALGDMNQSLVSHDLRIYGGGVELRYTDQIAGRIGYVYDKTGDRKGLTYGLGLGFRSLSLDYASVPQATSLPTRSVITLGYRF